EILILLLIFFKAEQLYFRFQPSDKIDLLCVFSFQELNYNDLLCLARSFNAVSYGAGGLAFPLAAVNFHSSFHLITSKNLPFVILVYYIIFNTRNPIYLRILFM